MKKIFFFLKILEKIGLICIILYDIICNVKATVAVLFKFRRYLIMSYPAIGIRPIVDGRRGPMKLRESLEPQVWAMAEAAKKLFEENLCYSDGTPVKVVLADTTIGRVPETAACAEKNSKRECCGYAFRYTLLVLWRGNDGYGPHYGKGHLGL